MVFIVTTYLNPFQPLVTKNDFFIDFDLNWHADAHNRNDEGYYVKKGFLPLEGTATCSILGFIYFFQLFSLLPLLVGYMMTSSLLNQVIRCKPS